MGILSTLLPLAAMAIPGLGPLAAAGLGAAGGALGGGGIKGAAGGALTGGFGAGTDIASKAIAGAGQGLQQGGTLSGTLTGAAGGALQGQLANGQAGQTAPSQLQQNTPNVPLSAGNPQNVTALQNIQNRQFPGGGAFGGGLPQQSNPLMDILRASLSGGRPQMGCFGG